MGDFLKFLFSKKFLKHFLIAILAFFFVGFLVLQYLKSYTSHGEAISVPELKGLEVQEADALLSNKDLHVEVIDSIFVVDKKPGIIVEQDPHPQAKIKEGRKIYVVINSMLKKKIPLPDIKDFSSRQAQTILESAGLKVESFEYVPSEFKDLVQQVKVNRKVINPGQTITVGTKVTLVVGQGLSDEKIHLPSFRSLALNDARQKARDVLINIGAVQYDKKPSSKEEEKEYFVYKQSPIAGTEVNLGKYIDVWLTKDKSKLDQPEEIQVSDDYDIENFFK